MRTKKRETEKKVKLKDTIDLETFEKKVTEIRVGDIPRMRARKSKDKLRKALAYFKRLEENARDRFDTRVIDRLRKNDSAVWKRLRAMKERELRNVFKKKTMQRVLKSLGVEKVRIESELVMGGFEIGRGLTYKGFRVEVYLVKKDGTEMKLRLKGRESTKSRPSQVKTDEQQSDREVKQKRGD